MNGTVNVPEVGVPRARSARTFALIGLGVMVIVGGFLWDLLGIIFGTPVAVIGLVGGLRCLPRTAPYPRDRRAALTAIAASIFALLLIVPIFLSAMK